MTTAATIHEVHAGWHGPIKICGVLVGEGHDQFEVEAVMGAARTELQNRSRNLLQSDEWWQSRDAAEVVERFQRYFRAA